jgi:transglutaminase-like putative cysteine protease
MLLLGLSVPGVWTAPATFEMDGYKGDFSSWQKVGEFDNLLNKGRETLPPRVVNEIQTLVKGETTQEAKVKKVYEYLQQHTRYISIQLGIGGLQPFEASLVAEKGYGDCKALSFFTKAMLKTIGIESHYASIKAGRPPQIF